MFAMLGLNGAEFLVVLVEMLILIGLPLILLVAVGALIYYFFGKRAKEKSPPDLFSPVFQQAFNPAPPPPAKRPADASKTEVMPRKCPQCGAILKPDAPEGLCPTCLLQRGFATEGGAAPGQPPFVPPSFSELSQLFPQLEILECLGRGGMGAVYKARQPRLDRFVALKILAPEKQNELQFAERFEREARALARLNHPNIVTVFDFGEVQGQFYLLMEFVDGLTLRQLLQTGKISPAEALNIVPKICEALQFAHEQGIVHRDIKPENILLDKLGRVKIADFGIAKIAGLEPKDLSLTGARDVMGTPNYMAPEQVEKPQTVDHRADIYSLGVVFYEMLTGELPLGKFQPPSQKVQVDVRLDEVVLHALEKEPARRYQHASQVKTAVETIAGSPAEFAGTAAGATAPPAFPVAPANGASDKAILPAFLLAFFFGVFGAHRFYVGKFITACVQLLALSSCILWIVLCAIGGPQPFSGLLLAGSIVGCIIWATIDWLLLVCKAFHDGKGRRMTNWTHSRTGDPSTDQQNLAGKKSSAPTAALPSVAPTNLPSAMITAPAIALMMAGLLKISAIVLNGWLLVPGSLAILGGFLGGGMLAGVGFLPFLAVALFEGIPGALILFGGYQMLQRRSYAWSVAAGILGIMTCGFISVPVGIWALVVLASDNVKAAFVCRAADPVASSQPNHFWRQLAVVMGSIILVFLGVILLLMLAFMLMPQLRSSAGWRAPLLVGGKPFHASAFSAGQLQQAGIRQEDGEYRKDSVQSFPLEADGQFSINNVDGPIEIHGWSSNAVTLKIAIHGKSADGVDAVKIKVNAQPGHADIHTDLDDHLDSGWNWLRMIGRSKASVAYIVQVPQHARLTGVHSVDGRITIEGVTGPITASAVDGSMEIKNAADNLTLSTVDGSISASLDTLGAGQSVSLHTVDGSITLALPAEADATVSVHTIDGKVTSEFAELQPNQKSVVGDKLNGTLGNGSAKVDAETVDGSVKIVKRQAAPAVPANTPAPLFYEWRGTDWAAISNHDFRVDSPVVTAAKKWLTLVDAGHTSESWQEAASVVQTKKTEADWTNLLSTNRTPLGKLISRRLVASIPLTLNNGVPTSPAVSGPITGSPPGAPDGPYVFMLFDSSFAEKKEAKENVTFRLEKDGSWKCAGYFIK